MQTTTKQKKNNKKPILEKNEKKLIWKKAKGIWKNRKPDPIKELNKIKKGWSLSFPQKRESRKLDNFDNFKVKKFL